MGNITFYKYKPNNNLTGREIQRLNSSLSEFLGGSAAADAIREIEPVWLGKRGAKLFTRISAWLNKNGISECNLSSVEYVASEIGRRMKTLDYDMTEDFMWNHGDFKDRNSCYWKEYSWVRLHGLAKMQGFAIRTWASGVGTGRCWAIPHREGFFLFNSYGNDLQMFADICKSHFGMSNQVHAFDVSIGEDRYKWYLNQSYGIWVGSGSLDEDLSCIHYEPDSAISFDGSMFPSYRAGLSVDGIIDKTNSQNYIWCEEDRIYEKREIAIPVEYGYRTSKGAAERFREVEHVLVGGHWFPITRCKKDGSNRWQLR